MAECHQNRHRRARARKRMKQWRRKDFMRKFAEANSEFLLGRMRQPSFSRLIFSQPEFPWLEEDVAGVAKARDVGTLQEAYAIGNTIKTSEDGISWKELPWPR